MSEKEMLPPDAMGISYEAEYSPFDYTPGNRQMMKEYGMTEEEWEYEFGGRPHQQRQSPVSRTDLSRLKIPLTHWDYCVHKYLPWYFCFQSSGFWYGGGRGCGHYFHELELCKAVESVRRNQTLLRKRAHHSLYALADKNWLYNDPNWGHMLWRSKYSVHSFKGRYQLGGGTRIMDPPKHELRDHSNPKYNSDIVRSDPHPQFWTAKIPRQAGHSFKHWWNRFGFQAPLFGDHKRSPQCVTTFDPVQEGAIMKPW